MPLSSFHLILAASERIPVLTHSLIGMRSTLLRMRVHAHSFQAPRPALQVLPFAASFQESSHPKDDKDISYRVQQAAPWEWWLSQTVSGGGTLVLS